MMTFEAQQKEHAQQKELEVMSILLTKAQEERQLYLNHLMHAAGFLDGVASRMDGFRREDQVEQAARDLRQYAENLRRLTTAE